MAMEESTVRSVWTRSGVFTLLSFLIRTYFVVLIDLFITSIITKRLGRHEVQLPINHKNNFLRKQ